MCHFYIRYQVHTGSSEDPDRGIHPCTKAVQDSQGIWNKEKGLFTVYLWCQYKITRNLGGTGQGRIFRKFNPPLFAGLSSPQTKIRL